MDIDKFNNLKNRLPDIPSINGKDEYFNSVVLLLLIPVNNKYHIVFQKRNQKIIQGGEICLPGGKFDKTKDSSLKKTALRETNEEMGIPENIISIIGRLDTVIASMGAVIDVFVGIADIKLSEMNINKNEVDQIFSIPVSYFEKNKPEIYSVLLELKSKTIDEKTGQEIILFPAEKLGLPEKYHNQWENFKQKVYVYKTKNGVIWGITARIIIDLINKLELN